MGNPAITPPVIDLSSAPGGELDLNNLFPAEPDALQPTTAPTPGVASTVQPASQTPPAVPVPAAPFLKAGESVYKTAEEAERGIAHKDAVIEQLRQREITRTGVDPLTGKAVQVSQAPASYLDNPDSFLGDLRKSVENNDSKGYVNAQQRLILEALAPFAPVLQELATSRSEERIVAQIPQFREFKSGQEYKETLADNPKLAQAIQLAETDVRYANDLPDLYKLAFAYGQYRKMPDLLKQAAQQPPANPAPPTRPTTTPGSIPVSAETNLDTSNVSEMLRTPEGRKAIIEAGRAKGLHNLKW